MSINLLVKLFDSSKKSKSKQSDLVITSSFKKKTDEKTNTKTKATNKSIIDLDHLNALHKNSFLNTASYKNFEGDYNKILYYPLSKENLGLMIGLGEKEKITAEKLRQSIAQLYKAINDRPFKSIDIDLNSFDIFDDVSKTAQVITEILFMTSYKFNKYQNQNQNSKNEKGRGKEKDKKSDNDKEIILTVKKPKDVSLAKEGIEKGTIIASGVNFARDLVNEVPNVMNSEYLSKVIIDDFKALSRSSTSIKNTKNKIKAKLTAKVLTLKEIKKEKMNLLLAVNQGSAHEPRVVQLNYHPNKTTKNTKHIALVGKGLTFDSGGYSLKPSTSIVGMKFDMAGAATVYGAFKNAILLHSEHIISCFIGITDNLVSSRAYLPDSVIKGRSGKTVEIISTDAEGRLVLADVLDYVMDFKPNEVIDVATLTGACVQALGHVCGVMGNNEDLTKRFLEAAKAQDERVWELPIFDEYRDDIKSGIADIKNSSTTRNAGAQKGAAFLEHFIKEGIKWIHLDIAGVDSASHLSYCPKDSASGIMIRSLCEFLLRQ